MTFFIMRSSYPLIIFIINASIGLELLTWPFNRIDAMEIVKVTIMAVAAIVGLIQLGLIYRTFKADHERRRKQATIEYLNMIRGHYRNVNQQLLNEYGQNPFGKEQVELLMNNPELWAMLKDLLGLFEHLAVGVNTGVFDIDLINRMAGDYLIGIFDRFTVYVQKRRIDSGLTSLYCEYEQLITQLKKIRLKVNPYGNMVHSKV